jgi:hypothetical protein
MTTPTVKKTTTPGTVPRTFWRDQIITVTVLAAIAVAVFYLRPTSSSSDKKLPGLAVDPYDQWEETTPRGVPGDDFFGFWQTRLQQSVVGPLGDLWNFTVADVKEGAAAPTWYAQNNYSGYLVGRTTQQYWIQFDQNMTTSNYTYCGALKNFIRKLEPVKVRIVMQQVKRNATYIEWYMDPESIMGVSARLSWTLLDGGRRMHLRFMLPADEVVHADMTLWRVAGEERATPAPAPVPCKLAWHYHSGFDEPGAPIVPEIPTEGQAVTVTKHQELSSYNGFIYKSRQLCPFGFKKEHDPATIAKIKAAQKKVSYLGYEHCYLINPSLNFTLRWDWSVRTESVRALISMTAPRNIDINTQWIALGIYPTWPLMQNMDVILGYFGQDAKHQGCVRSMYAELSVGAPVPNEVNQTITDREIWTEGNTMYIKFTRPWRTGHHDLSVRDANHVLPSISFAMGQAPGSCAEAPHYHGIFRGTYGMFFPNASWALPDHMKCPRVDGEQ